MHIAARLQILQPVCNVPISFLHISRTRREYGSEEGAKGRKITIFDDFGSILGTFSASFGDLLGVRSALGGVLVAFAAKKPSRAHKDAPKIPQGLPKREENGTGAPHFDVSGGPKITKNRYPKR